jgi:antitoxin VapB
LKLFSHKPLDLQELSSDLVLAIILAYIQSGVYGRSDMPQLAKIVKSGDSQAVRLPKDFRFDVDEVEITREGDAVVLRPKIDADRRRAALRAAIERGVSDDFMADGRRQPDGQDRPELDRLFE